MLSVIERMEMNDSAFRQQIAAFRFDCEQIGRQLRGWANSLQNSEIQGQRHQNEKSQRVFTQRQRQTAFLKTVDQMNEESQRQREATRQEQPPTDTPDDR